MRGPGLALRPGRSEPSVAAPCFAHRPAAAAICRSVACGDVSKRTSSRWGGDWSSTVDGVSAEPARATASAPTLCASRKRGDQRGRCRRQRRQLERGARDHGEAAERSAQELRQVVARDVLDDPAAGLGDTSVGQRDLDADDEIARRAVAVAPRAAVVGRDDAADRRAVGERRIERQPLAVRARSDVVDVVERRAGRERVATRSPATCSSGAVQAAASRARRRFGGRAAPRLLRARSADRRRREPLAVCRDFSVAGDARQRRHGSRQLVRHLRTAPPGRPASSGMLAIRARHLAAQPRRRKHLARIADAVRIERAAHAAASRRDRPAVNISRHVRLLVGADAVLAGDRAAGLDAVRQDLRRDLLGVLRLARDRLVVADERVQVAVARVKDVADAQARSRFERRGCGAAPRAASCAARRRPARSSSATRGPSPRTPPCVPSRCARAAPRSCATSIVVAPRAPAQRTRRWRTARRTSDRGPSSSTISTASASGKVRMHGGFGRVDRRADPSSRPPPERCRAPMMSTRPRRRRRSMSNAGEQRLHRLGPPQDPARSPSVTIASVPFRSDEDAEQIEAGASSSGAAEVHELAVRQHGLDAEHVVHGEAVLQAVRAARVLGDVAADRAHLLARRIGRVVVAEGRDLLRDRRGW